MTANDINSTGKVVGNDAAGGWYFDGTNRTTPHFMAQYPNTPPGPPPYSLSPTMVLAINDADQILGSTYLPLDPTGNLNGYVYDLAHTNSVAALLGPQRHPTGIGSNGEVVGNGFTFDGTNIGGLSGFGAVGLAINSAGLIVGYASPNDSGYPTATVFAGGTNSQPDLSPLYDIVGPRRNSYLFSVNDAGQMVGELEYAGSSPFNSAQVSVAFLYTNGTAVNLGGLGGFRSEARDINNAGLIVGNSMVADQTFHAFVYANGAMADLNTLISSGGSGWVLTSANAVNDQGVIVGEGQKDGVAHAFLLAPATDTLPSAVHLLLQLTPDASITVTGKVGQSFRIEAVDHVSDTVWQPLGNVTLTAATYLWVDSDSALHPSRFYRGVLLP